MKHLKLVIVLSAAVGLLAIAVPLGGGSLLVRLYDADIIEAAVYAAIFALPLVMGALALRRPPMQPWQAGVALAGFVLGVVRFRVWDTVIRVATADNHSSVVELLVLAAVVVGTAATTAVLLRPEPTTS